MFKKFIQGSLVTLGIVLVMSVVFAGGYHLASEILPGTFSSGNFKFDGNLNSTGDICLDSGNCLSAASGSIPSGVVVMWSGSIASIPAGWQLCDGTAGTPDLTDRFVIHADADAAGTNNVGDVGGSDIISVANLPSHSHGVGTLATSSSGVHNHDVTLQDSTASYGNGYGSGSTAGADRFLANSLHTDGAHTHAISGSTASVGTGTGYKPKYYALAYIMKI